MQLKKMIHDDRGVDIYGLIMYTESENKAALCVSIQRRNKRSWKGNSDDFAFCLQAPDLFILQ